METLTPEQLIKLLTDPTHQVMFDDLNRGGILDLLITVPTPGGDVDYMVSIAVDLTTAVKSDT